MDGPDTAAGPMKWVAVALAVAFFALAAATILARSPGQEARAERHFSPEEVARFRRHAFERRLIFWAGATLDLVVLGLLALTGLGSRLAAAGARLAQDRFLLTVLVVGAVCFVVRWAVSVPLDVYGGWGHRRAWGLTERSFLSWLGDYGKALALSAVVGAVLLLGLYALLRHLPRWWWLLAAAGSAGVAVFFAWVYPLAIAPLFNRFTPLGQTAHAALLAPVRSLVERAGLPVQEVLVMDASRQGRHTNAYFSGFGASRRIVLYDTLLDAHTPDEVLSVVGHEAGHWRRHHIVQGLVLGAAGALVGFAALAWLLRWASGREPFGLTGAADPAGLPLILLASYLGGFLALPVQNAVSRHFERQADRDALELAGRPEAFIEAEKRLTRVNLINPAPAPLAVWLFASHPPVLERIERAEAWAAAQGAAPQAHPLP